MVKQDAIKLINNLPDNVSWNDLMYHLYVHQKIEQGKEAASEGRVFSSAEARQMFSAGI